MDADKTKGRTWHGYVCPGCRTVFRVAADFKGAEVMCPSCEETLRLPQTPEEVRPHTVRPVKLPAGETVNVARPTKPTKPVRSADLKQDAGEPAVLRSMLATTDGRLKLVLALLVPLAVLVGGLLLYSPEELTPPRHASTDAPLFQPPSETPSKPVPPPPVAVSEMPDPAPVEPEAPPVPEVTVVEPAPPPAIPRDVESTPEVAVAVPETPVVEPEIATTQPETPAPPATAGEELVQAVPATTPAPDPEETKPEPEIAGESDVLVHTVVSGDTLSILSRRYQVSIGAIKKANGINGDVIMLGQSLRIPGGVAPAPEPAVPEPRETPVAPTVPRFHTVVRGDTLERIARKYGVEPRAIMEANDMKNDVVRLGRKLTIPPARP